MRSLVVFSLVGLCGIFAATEAQAQVRNLRTVRPINPYVGVPFVNSRTVLSPYGAVTLNTFGTTARPVRVGPYHTVYFDAFSNTYRYTTGYLNTPNVTQTLTVTPFVNPLATPYVANPYVVSPYLANPYLYGSPYLANPYLYR